MPEVILARTAGFCFGVKRAVELAYAEADAAKSEGCPVYSYGHIIHNEEVVRDLEARGVTVIEDE